ncbi:hypothetical protein [Massilia oculi]|uniref:hypothetical protein n=1 Tax=Massilia oculi TaxID=945844 RepID=UPI001AB01465|nr:hypothetical protein [Massilia oculi]
MKIEIDTKTITWVEAELLISLLGGLKEQAPDEEVNIDDTTVQDLSEDAVQEIVHKMHKFSLGLEFQKSFKANELYSTSTGGKWLQLSPNTRKAIGRQFKKVANEHWDNQKDGAIVIEFKERNIQNTAIYHVTQKESI